MNSTSTLRPIHAPDTRICFSVMPTSSSHPHRAVSHTIPAVGRRVTKLPELVGLASHKDYDHLSRLTRSMECSVLCTSIKEKITASYGFCSPLRRKAVAFLSTSLSSLRTLFSRLRRFSSSRSSVVSPSRFPVSICFHLSQLHRVSVGTPRSPATSESGFPEDRASFTASALNSGGYGGLVLGTWTPSRDSIGPKSKGVR